VGEKDSGVRRKTILRTVYRLSFAFLMIWLMLLVPAIPQSGASHQGDGDDFVQVGPSMDKLLFKVYADETAEFLQLAAGELDVTDWPLTTAFLDSGQPCANNGFPNCPNIGLTPPIEEFGMFLFEFNNNITWWGFDFQNGLNPDGAEIRRAMAHLLDKDAFLATDPLVAGLGSKIDNPAPPSQLSGSDVPDFNLYDPDHCTPVTDPCLSAFNNSTDTNPSGDLTGFAELDSSPSAGNQPSGDWKAALEHLAKVRNPSTGLPGYWVDNNGDGVIDTNRPTTTVEFFCRVDHKPRDRYCNGIASRLNQMFGTPVVVVQEKTISQVSSIVFSTQKPDDWHAYSGGWGLTPDWDHLYDLYVSVFASDTCRGPRSNFAANYAFTCDDGNDIGELPQGDPNLREVSPGYFVNLNENDYDALAYRVKFAPTLAASKTSAKDALLRFGQMAFNIPVYSSASKMAYLKDGVVGGAKATASSVPDGNGWTGIINQKGVGPPQGWSWLNMYSSQPFLSGTVRIGMRQGTLHTDVFKSTTVWEFLILSPLYDSLLTLSPYDPNQLMSSTANSWIEGITSVQLGYNPDTVLGLTPGTVKSSIRFNLRTDAFFHDGNQVSAEDVEFTIEQFKAAPADIFLSSVINVAGVTCGSKPSCIDASSSGASDDSTDTKLDYVVDVHFNSQSFVFIKNIGGLPILPKHVWDSDHNGSVDSGKLGNAFDAMKNYALIGSGPWVCKDLLTGQVGGRCSNTASSSTDVGDSIALVRFRADPLDPRKQYVKSIANFKEWNYADGFRQASTGDPLADDQLVNIQDVGAILLCFGQIGGSCQYWNDADPAPEIDPTTVDIVETGIVLRWFGVSQFDNTVGGPGGTRWTYNLLWNQYLNTQTYQPTLPNIPP